LEKLKGKNLKAVQTTTEKSPAERKIDKCHKFRNKTIRYH